MQDRYLFRGKRLDNREWVCGDLNMPNSVKPYILPRDLDDDFEIGEHEIDTTTIGQCTGLHATKSYRGEDERDRLIYQGDLLSYKEVIYTDCSKEEIEEILPEAIIEVISYREMASIVKVHKGEVRAICHDVLEHQALILELDGDELEIIGNIHERPELSR